MGNQRVENVKPHILRQCREQIGLTEEEVQKKENLSIHEIESGEKYPTFRQLERIARLYCVPQWVFLREALPVAYDFNQQPAFRQFARSSGPISKDHKIKVIVVRVEQFRELVLELRHDLEEPVEPFSPPNFTEDISRLASSVKQWLKCTGRAYSFDEWRKAFEGRGIFVFLTSRYKSWSKVDPLSFRGFSIYKEKLPIIVINASDAKKSLPFTLLHELGHLLRKESAVDDGSYADKGVEDWCDKFAGEVLMPEDAFIQAIQGVKITDQPSENITETERIAEQFEVSPVACAVRMRQLGKINSSQYRDIYGCLQDQYKKLKEEQKKDSYPMERNIAKEALHQYGGLYSRAVMQAYHDQEIGLHKLCKLFGIKQTEHIIHLMDK